MKRSRMFIGLLSASVLTAIMLSLFLPNIPQIASDPFQAGNPGDAPYIIVFKDKVDPNSGAPGLAKAYGLQAGFIYQHALKGMSALVPTGRLEALKHDPAA